MSAGGLVLDRRRRLRRWLRGLGRELYVGLTPYDAGFGPATVEQLRRIDTLCDDRLLVSPAWQPLSRRQAETIIAQLLDGTYNPDSWESKGVRHA